MTARGDGTQTEHSMMSVQLGRAHTQVRPYDESGASPAPTRQSDGRAKWAEPVQRK